MNLSSVHAAASSFSLEIAIEIDLGSPIGQCRAVPIALGKDAPPAVLLIYGGDFEIDPYHEMFFFPKDTLKMVLLNGEGAVLWRRDLGRGVVPGIWFCPVFPFDLDGDGVDEIYYVGNRAPSHPLSLNNYCLERIDAHSGDTVGQWSWPAKSLGQTMSHQFRNFILGGFVHGKPVLITAQGTYTSMHLQGWNPDMTLRWGYDIAADAPGARGSHMCSVVDINGDGVDEVMWGERAIELDGGRELFCADQEHYRGHSDVVQPFYDLASQRWFLFTVREGDRDVSPRVATFDHEGNRVWGNVDEGHMDMGWIARLGDDGQQIASVIRIGEKTCGPDGRFHTEMTEFAYDACSGESLSLGFSAYRTLPVDLDGDGLHELVRGQPSGNGEVLDRYGSVIANVGAPVAMACKFLDMPGEQLLAYYPTGIVRVWRDVNAQDSEAASARYNHPFYTTNRRFMATGYNLPVLGGI